jgi:hypothetical protein
MSYKVIPIKPCEDRRIALGDDLVRKIAADQNRRFMRLATTAITLLAFMVLGGLLLLEKVIAR